MIVAGWAWDDNVLALINVGTVCRIGAMVLLLDLLLLWFLVRLAGNAE